ncbi:MAG: glycosyltransferase, partial [Microcystaceae cyanobacterium]
SGIAMILFFLWALPILYWGLKVCYQQLQFRLAIELLMGFVGSAIALFFAITYFGEMDITRGARYSFVYFPAIILLVGASLSAVWNQSFLEPSWFGIQTKKRLFFKRNLKLNSVIFLLMGITSCLTVSCNLGYQKYYRPDQLVSLIEQKSSVPVLIATTHTNLVQTGEMMGVAWKLRHNPLASRTSFLLAHQLKKDFSIATVTLQKNLSQRSQPLDLWLVNFHGSIELDNCLETPQNLPRINGYEYSLYHCNSK